MTILDRFYRLRLALIGVVTRQEPFNADNAAFALMRCSNRLVLHGHLLEAAEAITLSLEHCYCAGRSTKH